MDNLVKEFELDVFIKGVNVDLCLPSRQFAEKSTWYKWFNNDKTTRYLEQGIFPNTSERQGDFFSNLHSSNERVSLVISDKEKYIGTISLSFIDLFKRTADIAMLIGEKSNSDNSDLIALEAMALMTDYGLMKVGLKKISAGQHENLFKWQQKLELLGYRLEGFKQLGFLKANEEADSVIIGCNYKDYKTIIASRGKIWDNNDGMRSRLAMLPKESFVKKFKEFILSQGEDYYENIFSS
jgi:RimJ/RimL family protein N-acetyltransferase